MVDARIPTYLSHSYRPADREINEFFHEMFWEAGFAFTVDPKSTTLSTTHLEMMMRDSACFVAVVTARPDTPYYQCSPFAVYEYGLAIQDHKPRLVFVEAGVPARHFDPDDVVTPAFNRSRLSSYRVSRERIEALAELGRASTETADRPRGDVGVILPSSREYRDATKVVENLLGDAGYTPVVLPCDGLDSAEAARLLDGLDFVVVEVDSPGVPSWVFPFVQGRFVPSIKLIGPGAGRGRKPDLHPLMKSAALKAAEQQDRQAIWWFNVDELTVELERHINLLHVPRRQFHSKGEGVGYFRSIGRAPGRVFLSTAQADNPLAEDVVRALDLANIDHFHYIYHNTLRLGTAWEQRLLAKVTEYPLFVPLLSASYWDSEWCRKELQTAEKLLREGRAHILPYFLDHSARGVVSRQGTSLHNVPRAEQVERILTDIDRHLVEQASLAQRPRTALSVSGPMARPEIDVAIMASSAEEYDALLGYLDMPKSVTGTHAHPNRFSWMVGGLEDRDGKQYRLLISRSGNGMAEAVRATVNAFGPDYVLVLGAGRATGAGVHQGDVVISERIQGFGYGGPRHDLHPRRDWMFSTDPAIAATAKVVSLPDLPESRPASAGPKLSVHVGMVGAVATPLDTIENAAFTRVAQTWPEILAVVDRIGPVDVLEELRERRVLTQYAVVTGIDEEALTENGAGRRTVVNSAAMLAQRTAWVITRLIATAWPVPPRCDERL